MTERQRSTDVWAFLRAFGGRWLTLMSGPTTVPLAIAALYVENNLLRSFFAVLTVVCGVFSCYWVWREERIARVAAEARVGPRLEFVIEDCCRRQDSLGLVGVANPTASSVEDARVYLTIPRLQLDDRVLKWAGMDADVGLDIHPGPRARHAHTQAFLIVGNADLFWVQTAYGLAEKAEPGNYVGELCVKGHNVVATTAQIEFTFGPARSLTVRLVAPDRALTSKN
jgi:hypothetical protein